MANRLRTLTQSGVGTGGSKLDLSAITREIKSLFIWASDGTNAEIQGASDDSWLTVGSGIQIDAPISDERTEWVPSVRAKSGTVDVYVLLEEKIY